MIKKGRWKIHSSKTTRGSTKKEDASGGEEFHGKRTAKVECGYRRLKTRVYRHRQNKQRLDEDSKTGKTEAPLPANHSLRLGV